MGELWRWAVRDPSIGTVAAAVFPGDSALHDCAVPTWGLFFHFAVCEAALHWQLVFGVVLLVLVACLLRFGRGGFVLALELRPSRSGEHSYGSKRVAAYRTGGL